MDYIVHVVMTSTFQAPALSDGDIRSLWTSPTIASNTAARLGGWVSPLPRVTRTSGTTSAAVTHASGLWSYEGVPGAGTPATLAMMVRDQQERVQRAFAPRWTDTPSNPIAGARLSVEMVPYNPAVHGPRSFWTGQHANTRTAREFPGPADELARGNENPIGPGGGTTSLGDLASGLTGGSLLDVTRALAWVAVPAAIIAGLVYSKPLIDWVTMTRARKVDVVRSNPRRHRRR